MIKIGLLGYSGRMGQAIAAEIAASNACVLTGGVVRAIKPEYKKAEDLLITSHADEVVAISDVVIDFTLPEATVKNVEISIAHKKPLVCGTTGLGAKELEALHQASKKIPVLCAPNTSLSLAAMKQITALAAKLLGGFDYDIAIIDEHHKMKKDAPSGTAKALGDVVMEANNGKKTPSFAAIRAGHIVGNHEVIFTGNGETIRLRHSVTDRAIFARGAVQAALWLYNKPAGFYGMDDVLGIKA
jgi:4-hydroxy-tetrahydrodipicolinate reductase